MTAFSTQQVQTGYDGAVAQNSAVPPIHQTAAYEFASLADAADIFALRRVGNLYSRSSSPTQLILEQRVAALEGGVAAVAVASGQAAVAVTLLALAGRGGHIVAAAQLYGGTVTQLDVTLRRFGVETKQLIEVFVVRYLHQMPVVQSCPLDGFFRDIEA